MRGGFVCVFCMPVSRTWTGLRGVSGKVVSGMWMVYSSALLLVVVVMVRSLCWWVPVGRRHAAEGKEEGRVCVCVRKAALLDVGRLWLVVVTILLLDDIVVVTTAEVRWWWCKAAALCGRPIIVIMIVRKKEMKMAGQQGIK